jgi:hypothetical protein
VNLNREVSRKCPSILYFAVHLIKSMYIYIYIYIYVSPEIHSIDSGGIYFGQPSHGAPVACPYLQTVAQENRGTHVVGKLFSG